MTASKNSLEKIKLYLEYKDEDDFRLPINLVDKLYSWRQRVVLFFRKRKHEKTTHK